MSEETVEHYIAKHGWFIYQSKDLVSFSAFIGKDEFQRNTLGGGYTFSPAIDGETCYWRTRDEAYEEIDRLKAKGDKNCLMWKITKSTKITPIDY